MIAFRAGDHNKISLVAGVLTDTGGYRHVERVVELPNEEADAAAVRALVLESSGTPLWPVVELLDRFENRTPGFRLDGILAIDDGRHRAYGHSGPPGDVGNGHFFH